MKMMDLQEEERPREKLIRRGAGSLCDVELLAILLRTGVRDASALDVSRNLLRKAGGRLTAIADMSVQELTDTEGIGPGKAAAIVAALETGRRFMMERSLEHKVPITTPELVYREVIPILKGLSHEECWVLYLNRGAYLISKERISAGGMEATILDTKTIARRALELRASNAILVHNHPSGNPEPGRADISRTEALKSALATIEVSLMDHVVVSDGRYFSFADNRSYSARNF